MNQDYFSLLDILATVFWAIVIIVIGYLIRESNSDKPYYRFYMPNLFAKLIFSFGFAWFYVSLVNGGDTVAYFDGAVKLNNLFLKSPALYFEQMFTTPSTSTMTIFFDGQTGLPPGWIYREPESFFVCKILSLISFLGFGSFFAVTFIVSFLTAQASWKFFEFVRQMRLTREIYLAIGILFIPSVNFWCTGISKDTFVFIGILMCVYHGFKMLERKNTLKHLIYLILFMVLIYNIRSFLVGIFIMPFLLATTSRYIRRVTNSNFATTAYRTVLIIGSFLIMSFYFGNQSEQQLLESNALLEQASITQKDFEVNETYSGNRYSIGEIEFTFTGLLQVTPAAIVAGLFRPFPWEANESSLIFNGIESFFLIFLVIQFIVTQPARKWRRIQRNEFLVFSLVFVVFLAMVTGLTSGLFGVLVRLRAPILPFLIILLTIGLNRRNGNNEKNTISSRTRNSSENQQKLPA